MTVIFAEPPLRKKHRGGGGRSERCRRKVVGKVTAMVVAENVRPSVRHVTAGPLRLGLAAAL